MSNTLDHEYTLVSNYCALAGFIILAYDSMLTLSQELSFFLKGGFTYSKTLYFTLRYSLVIAWLDAFLLTFGLLKPSSLTMVYQSSATIRSPRNSLSNRYRKYITILSFLNYWIIQYDVMVINCNSNPVKTSSFKLYTPLIYIQSLAI
ncbi:hypothetical protein BU17DRAFT_65642 [Hysterangium stoloniferum]|nr:hypothetical protein BU17DRAFT_65642 [Hysterangium stoloniferum]